MSSRICPECGYPVTSEKTCPECGYPFSNQQSQSQSDSVPHTSDNAPEPPRVRVSVENNSDDFNESPQPYSPFGGDSWFFKAPYPLSRYPRGKFRKTHKFLGWLTGPFHISSRKASETGMYDPLNNFFYFCNLLWKMIVYPALWVFFKMWWTIAILIVLAMVAVSMPYEYFQAMSVFSLLIAVIIYTFAAITYLCGWGESLHRYFPQLHSVVYRMCHRFCNSMYAEIKNIG